jgi:hypothetical protein
MEASGLISQKASDELMSYDITLFIKTNSAACALKCKIEIRVKAHHSRNPAFLVRDDS